MENKTPKRIKYKGQIYETINEEYRKTIGWINFLGLPGIEAINNVPQNLLKYPVYWWLKDPGYDKRHVMYVYPSGVINEHGGEILWEMPYPAVRPAVWIPGATHINDKIKELGLQPGDEVILNGFKFIIISDEYMLYNGEPIRYPFDNNSNDYVESALFKNIIKQFQRKLHTVFAFDVVDKETERKEKEQKEKEEQQRRIEEEKKDLANQFVDILENGGFYYDADDILKYFYNSNDIIELTGKANGDSYDKYIEEVFSSSDLSKLKNIAKKLGFKLPEEVYYD